MTENHYVEMCEGKPSKALEYLIAGLKRTLGDETRRFNPMNYGRLQMESGQVVCYGCLATWGIDEMQFSEDGLAIAKRFQQRSPEDYADLLNPQVLKLSCHFVAQEMVVGQKLRDAAYDFEDVLDYLRRISYGPLFELMEVQLTPEIKAGIKQRHTTHLIRDQTLSDDSLREVIQQFESVVSYLKEQKL
jgi:hypothetical protein